MEVKQTLQPGQCLGLWQMSALPNVLGCTLHSLYPDIREPVNRLYHNRMFLPRVNNNPAMTVLWSSTRDDMNEEFWVANHVSLAIPLVTR